MTATISWLGRILVAIFLMNMSGTAAPAATPPWEIETLPGTAAPAFSLPDLSGNQTDSASLHGKVRLINFWATWCGPCREEMPGLMKLQHQFQQQGLVVIGIDIDSDKAAAKDFVAKTGTDLLILHDPAMKTHDAYKVFTYPTTFLIDRKGIIKQYWIGAQNWNGKEIEELITNTLR